ncbi:small secreted protein [Streptomyces sp. BR123]|uniref:small secreted protein n=1 Tax=Streptomyces sp. BR123 TaxID=2749828 RepID=UPI0015C44FDB|nr:small secreted protein [Streptomyces sp. BR123]NXY96579.1 small secreted protein [Streptomyces sp. BR123]
MNKKFASAVSGGAVLMLVLSGCGGDDGDEKANAWAKKVCDQWAPELQKVKAASADMKRVSGTTSKPDEVQKTDSAAFQVQSDAYKAMSAALSSAGTPPTKDGQATQTAAVQGFEAASKAYADLKTKIDALDPKDQTKFADGLGQLSAAIAEANKGSKEAYAKVTAGDLKKAIAGQKGCKMS